MNAYHQRQWQVKEYPFRRHDLPHTETILTIGNGLIGTRGTLEEGYPGDQPVTLAAGIFNHKAGELIPELVALPDWLPLLISIDGETFHMDTGKVLGFERILDLKTGILSRGVLWCSPAGTVVQLQFERFASLADPHLLALAVTVKILTETDSQHTLAVTSALDGTRQNPAIADPDAWIDHWAWMEGWTGNEILHISGGTDQSGYSVAMRSHLQIEGGESAVYTDVSAPRLPAHTATATVPSNQPIRIIKLVAVHTTRDGTDPDAHAASTLNSAIALGYETIKAAHIATWAACWDRFDIRIDGDEVAQRAIRFCTYHILIAVPQHDERTSIGAKTLSGFGYRGHVFWDTELFMVPPMTLCDPTLARGLLMYRYHNLPGARAKAAEAGYEGAMFPWESTDTGEETTPRWVGTKDNLIRIWTGDNEQHISTDIAYAALQYWRWTGDDDWMAHYGAEIVLDTARFWGSRAEWNAEAGRYELRQQIGPDEYHENIDNSVFTNRMVRWHLEQADALWDWMAHNRPHELAQLRDQLDLTAEGRAHWAEVARKLWIPISEEHGGVFEQFEGFFDRLKPIDLTDYAPRTTNMDVILGHARTQRTRVIKQADVVMLMALLGDELGDRDFLRRNWETYLPTVDHGSSLSPSIHAWVGARLGLIDLAYDLFIYSATLDLEDHKGNVRDGIHAACCGGVWQAVVFGFCGLRLTDAGVETNPQLPAHWRRVQFTVMHRGEPVVIDIKGNES